MRLNPWFAMVSACIAMDASTASADPPSPTKPVRFIVPYAAGGVDILARLVAPRLGKRLGQRVIVDNRDGAGGKARARAITSATRQGASRSSDRGRVGRARLRGGSVVRSDGAGGNALGADQTAECGNSRHRVRMPEVTIGLPSRDPYP